VLKFATNSTNAAVLKHYGHTTVHVVCNYTCKYSISVILLLFSGHSLYAFVLLTDIQPYCNEIRPVAKGVL